MAVNYYGHFHLMELLLPKLEAQQTPSRVVIMTCQKVATGPASPVVWLSSLEHGVINIHTVHVWTMCVIL